MGTIRVAVFKATKVRLITSYMVVLVVVVMRADTLVRRHFLSMLFLRLPACITFLLLGVANSRAIPATIRVGGLGKSSDHAWYSYSVLTFKNQILIFASLQHHLLYLLLQHHLLYLLYADILCADDS